jgi:hypothetical protein
VAVDLLPDDRLDVGVAGEVLEGSPHCPRGDPLAEPDGLSHLAEWLIQREGVDHQLDELVLSDGGTPTGDGPSRRILKLVEDDVKRAWLAHYGAPLYGQSALSGRAAPELERLVVDALGLSRRDPSLTRALPVLPWRRRGDLDMAKLVGLAQAKGRERTLGFFLDLAARLSGDRRLRSAAAALRSSSPPPSTNFFTNHQGALARVLADQNTPPVARAWGYRMNMGMDAFESMFAKAKATEREALLGS